MNTITPAHFRNALRNHATGVTIITARNAGGQPVGMTVNSFASVSLEPPLVLWSIDKVSVDFDAFLATGHYAVHILRQDQQQVARTFSDDDAEKFGDLIVEQGIADLPLLSDYSVLLQCEVENRHAEGDHVILIGRVIDIRIDSAEPLLFFGGRFAGLQN